MLHGTLIAPDESQFAVGSSKFAAGGSEGGNFVVIPDAYLLFNCEFKRVGNDLKLIGEDGATHTVRDYFRTDKHPALVTPEGAQIPAAMIDALAGHQQVAQAGAQPGTAEAIGKVATVAGNCQIVRNGVAVTVNAGDVVLKNDVLRTGGDGALGVTFNDGTTFSLSANAQMSVNEYVYQDGGANNQALFNLVRGSISFFASQVAKTGDMKVVTPTATMGIRGTTVVVDIVVNTQSGAIGQVKIKLYADQNGNVGRVEVFSNTGALLGTLTATATGFVITPAGTQPDVTQEQVSQQDAARDLALLQQLFNSTNIGNQLLQQQGGPKDPNDPNNTQPNSNPGTNGSNGSGTPDNVLLTLNATQTTNSDGTTTVTVTGATITTTPASDSGGGGTGGTTTPETTPVVLGDTPTITTITRGDGDDSIPGTAGPDIIFAGGGNDTIEAGAGDDQVYGQGGDDVIVAGEGAGNDLYDGGAGNDTITFESTTQGVIVDLAAGTASGFETGNDTLVNIENATGGSGGDILIGTAGANVLTGLAGNDEIDGGGGADTMLGGEGNDTIFVHDDAGWFVDGGAGIDRIVFVGSFNILDGEGEGPHAQNIEIVDLNTTDDNAVDFDAQGIAEMNDEGVVRILGGPGDTVHITDGFEGQPDGYWRLAGEGVEWDGGDTLTAGVAFNKFEFVSVDGEAETIVATVWLEQGVQSNLYDLISQPSASDDTAEMTENQVLFIDVLANDDSAGADPKTLQSLGAIAIEGPDGVTLGTPAIVIENNQIRITPGTAFDALAEGETATITIAYTMRNAAGDTDSAVATVTVTGTNDAPYFSTLPEGFETIGTVVADSGFGGIDAIRLTTNGASAAQIETFLGLQAGTLAAISAQESQPNANLNPTNGAAIAFDLELVAGETVTFTWNFASTEYKPYNDFAFFSSAPSFGDKLADIFMIGDSINDGVLHSSGWQEYSFTAQDSGEYRLGIGAMNTGDQAFNSFLYVSGFSGLGFERHTTEDGGLEVFDLLNGVQDVDTNDILVAINAVFSATDQNGEPLDATGAVTIEGNSVTVDPAFFDYLAAGETVTVVVHYAVSDGHTTVNNTATLVIAGADDPNTPPGTQDVFAQGGEDASGISIPLAGSDAEDGDVTTFRITSLPDNGTLYTQDVSAPMVAVTLNQLVHLNGSTQFFFVPDGNWSGETSFTYAALDSDEAQDQTDATATITVHPVNDAPSIDPASLAAVGEDAPNPAGESIAALFDGKFHDVDDGASLAGIAVSGNDADPLTHGYWQYWCEGANVWLDIGLVSPTDALALEAGTLIRFLPAPGFSGTPTPLLVHALDDTYAGAFTSAIEGGAQAERILVDATNNGGPTAISASAAEIGTTVIAEGPAVVTATVPTANGFDMGSIIPGFINADLDAIGQNALEAFGLGDGILLSHAGRIYAIPTENLTFAPGPFQNEPTLTGGTITGLYILDEQTGGLLFSADGFDIDATAMQAAIQFYDDNNEDMSQVEALFRAHSFVIAGGEGSDTLAGGVYSDTIDGGGGADAMEGEGGNDIFIVRDGAAWIVNGGEGVDTLRFAGAFDVLSGNDSLYGGGPEVSGIEIIDLNEDAANTVDIDAQGVADMLASSETGSLRVLGGDTDILNLTAGDGFAGNWLAGAADVSFDGVDDYTDGVVFDEYYFTDGNSHLATIYVQHGITVNTPILVA